jgi:hypothetical protein
MTDIMLNIGEVAHVINEAYLRLGVDEARSLDEVRPLAKDSLIAWGQRWHDVADHLSREAEAWFMTVRHDVRPLSTLEMAEADLAARADPETMAIFDQMAGSAAIAAEDASQMELAWALDDVVLLLDRFMAMSEEQLHALALWVAMTHVYEDFDVVPYLFVTSAEKRCGKSLLLDLLEVLALRGRSTANISPAALYRMLDEQHPTLLFDEVDQFFPKGGKVDASKSDLIGLINAGFRKGRATYRMGGAKMRELEEFDAFGPKALAGIGGCLPDTTADRCIPIRLERKAPGVTRERYRIRVNEPEARQVGEVIGRAVSASRWSISVAGTDLPTQLNDRQQDVWEPLLAIADAAGGDWPQLARKAAVALHGEFSDETESLGVKLLTDIRAVFIAERLMTKQLADLLCAQDESPWPDWRGGSGLTSAARAKLLRPFGIRSKPIRVAGDKGRGFEQHQFHDAFDRYLLDPAVDTVGTVDNGAFDQVTPVHTSVNRSVDAGVDTRDGGAVHVTQVPSVDIGVDDSDLGFQAVVHGAHTVHTEVPQFHESER